MPLLAYHAGELIPDFQSAAQAETLLLNAERRGLDPAKVEVREVTDEEFAAALKPYQDAAAAAQAAQDAALYAAADAVLEKHGWSREEFDLLVAATVKRLQG